MDVMQVGSGGHTWTAGKEEGRANIVELIRASISCRFQVKTGSSICRQISRLSNQEKDDECNLWHVDVSFRHQGSSTRRWWVVTDRRGRRTCGQEVRREKGRGGYFTSLGGKQNNRSHLNSWSKPGKIRVNCAQSAKLEPILPIGRIVTNLTSIAITEYIVIEKYIKLEFICPYMLVCNLFSAKFKGIISIFGKGDLARLTKFDFSYYNNRQN